MYFDIFVLIALFNLGCIVWLTKNRINNLEYQVNNLEYVVRRLNSEKIEYKNGAMIITQENFMEPS